MNAKRLESAKVWRSVTDPTKFQFPGAATDVCPAGYEEIVLDSIRAMEKFTKKFNEQERIRLTEEREYQKLYFDRQIRKHRQEQLEKLWHNPRAIALLRACATYVDAKREKKYARKIEPNFHLQPLEFDASNRQGFSSEDTGWKDKKA
jgi:DNA topoisomerase IA